MCRRCRNKRGTYCSKECRRTYRRAAHRKAQSKYRRSKKGKKKNKINEKRRRKRLRKPKSVADRGTTPGSFGCKISPARSYQPDLDVNMDADTDTDVYKRYFPAQAGKRRMVCCDFCGRIGTIVDKFSRRGYIRRRGYKNLKRE